MNQRFRVARHRLRTARRGLLLGLLSLLASASALAQGVEPRTGEPSTHELRFPAGVPVDQAWAIYEEAMATAPVDLRLLTANNFGVWLMEAGEPELAVDVLAAAVEESNRPDVDIPERHRSKILYNLGRVSEDAWDLEKALDLYQEAGVELTAAVEGSFRVASRVSDAALGLQAAVRLIEKLTERRSLEKASDFLSSSLEDPRWLREDIAGELVEALVRYLQVSQADLEAFKFKWWSPLEEARRHTPRAADVIDAYIGALPEEEDSEIYRNWDALPERAYFAALLCGIGDDYSLQDRNDLALRRYRLAWRLNPQDTQARRSLVWLLETEGGRLDPDGSLRREVLGQAPPHDVSLLEHVP